jgi:hypothetical protein
MRKLKTTDVTGAVIGMPVKAGVLEHLQNSYTELFQSLMKHISGLADSSSTAFVLYGCVNSGTAPVYNITAGAIYYQGEIFLVDAAAFTAAVGAVVIIETTQYTAVDSGGNQKGDPVLFSDLVSRNILNIRKIKFVDGDNLTAGFIDNFSDIVYVQSDWITVGDAGAPAFENSWDNDNTSTENSASFKKRIDNTVQLRGAIKTGSSNTTVFTLPTGFRPQKLNYFICAVPGDPANVAVVSINSFGTVNIKYSGGAVFALDSIRFSLD